MIQLQPLECENVVYGFYYLATQVSISFKNKTITFSLEIMFLFFSVSHLGLTFP